MTVNPWPNFKLFLLTVWSVLIASGINHVSAQVVENAEEGQFTCQFDDSVEVRQITFQPKVAEAFFSTHLIWDEFQVAPIVLWWTRAGTYKQFYRILYERETETFYLELKTFVNDAPEVNELAELFTEDYIGSDPFGEMFQRFELNEEFYQRFQFQTDPIMPPLTIDLEGLTSYSIRCGQYMIEY